VKEKVAENVKIERALSTLNKEASVESSVDSRFVRRRFRLIKTENMRAADSELDLNVVHSQRDRLDTRGLVSPYCEGLASESEIQ